MALEDLPAVYEEDELLWLSSTAALVQQMNDALRHRQLPPILYLWRFDWGNLLDFLVSAGRRERRAAVSLTAVIVRYVLCLQHAGATDYERNLWHWTSEVSHRPAISLSV